MCLLESEPDDNEIVSPYTIFNAMPCHAHICHANLRKINNNDAEDDIKTKSNST